jgi:hypothetical protein
MPVQWRAPTEVGTRRRGRTPAGGSAAAVAHGRIGARPGQGDSVSVEPWTLTATLYPGARWSGFANDRVIAMQPVTTTLKAVTIGGLVVFTVLAARGRRA